MEVEVVTEGLDGGDDLGGVPLVHVVVEQDERDVRGVSFSTLDTQLGQLKRGLSLGEPHSRGSTDSSPGLAELLEEDLGQDLVTLALEANSENDGQSFLSGDEVDLLRSITVVNDDGLLGRLALDSLEALGERGSKQVTLQQSEGHGQSV